MPLESSEFEWMFRKNVGNKKENGRGASKSSKNAIPAVEVKKNLSLLDPRKAQNVGIAIARFRMPISEVREAIIKMDETRFGVDKLNILIPMAPTVEEQDMLKNFEGDKNLLGEAEKFFLEMLSIPRFNQRIKCFRFKLQFETRVRFV